MRFSLSPEFGKSTGNVLVAVFLASIVTGCSSDVMRFGGYSSGSDQITTNSIPDQNYSGSNGNQPTPRADVASGGAMVQPGYSGRQEALNQPYPAQPYPAQPANGGYNSSTAIRSNARMATAPVSVQRAELAAPSPSRSREREAALAQPFPSEKKASPIQAAKAAADPITTGTTPKVSGWSSANAPSVTLRPGESVATLSKRYGVPEKEILRVNSLKNSAAAKPGQQILIPTFNGGNAAKAASQAADLSKGGNLPEPSKAPTQDVAVLPAGNSVRDKSQAAPAPSDKLAAGAGKDPKGAGGTYVVKPGDSLAKIAKATGTRIDDLKAANGLTAGTVRIGQVLKVPGAGSDTVKTASIPAKAVTKVSAPANDAASAQPAPYKPPVASASQSISDVEKKTDVAVAAPESTGIGKYRWPVRGAVIAGYGANVEGNRNDGIDISVPEGTPIKAAENGVVIYAGNGLKELGNTVLLRHDDGTVTVYGHADALSVARGQKVQRGQTLATSGMSGNAKQPQVHFEVRKDAAPVNPMTFLE